jgi:hypothetical protein
VVSERNYLAEAAESNAEPADAEAEADADADAVEV